MDAGGEEKRDKRSLSLLLVQKYLLFQYKSTNTDAYNALRQDGGIMYLVTRLKDLVGVGAGGGEEAGGGGGGGTGGGGGPQMAGGVWGK